MENYTQNDQQKFEPNFYRLDTSKPHEAERGGSVASAIILMAFASVFLLIDIVAIAFNPTIFQTDAVVAPILLAVFGLGFLAYGIFLYKKEKNKTQLEQKLFEDCLLTDGKIEQFNCDVRRTKNSTSYHVTLTYSFFDKTKKRSASFSEVYGTKPKLFEGQNVMVAFNETTSVILRKFSISVDDEYKFEKTQQSRAVDDFLGLDGKSLNVDRSQPIKNIENSNATFALSAVFCFFAVVFAIVIPVVLGIDKSTHVPWPFWILIGAFPAALLCVAIVMLASALKIRRRFLNVLNDPYCNFTLANIFFNEKTYSEHTTDAVVICYINDLGEKKHSTSDSKALREKVANGQIQLVVAYTREEVAVVLECTLL